MLFHIYNTCLNLLNIFSHFSGGIYISSTFLEFSSVTDFFVIILSAILFPISSPAASAALWTTFLEAISEASSSASKNYFLYLLQKVLTNDKNPYPLIYFLFFLLFFSVAK